MDTIKLQQSHSTTEDNMGNLVTYIMSIARYTVDTNWCFVVVSLLLSNTSFINYYVKI